MANTVLTPDIIAKEAVRVLENELVMAAKVYRGFEEEFNGKVNGYKKGASVTVRKPADFTVRDGAVMSTQDVVEGETTISVDKQKGIDFQFSSTDLTLSMTKMSERVIKPAMIQLANQVDVDLMDLYKHVPSWVGTPGQAINSFKDFAEGPKRADNLANPQGRCAVLNPDDHWDLLGSQTQLYTDTLVKPAYRKGNLGMVGNVDMYTSSNAPTHTVGVATGTPLVKGAAQDVTYETVKNSFKQDLVTDGWTNSTTDILKAGDVFTIANVYAVNSVTKKKLPFLRQFVVNADADSGGSTGPATLSITPPIITSGAQQTVDTAPADNAAITVVGTGGADYRQNVLFHKNAFALTMVPMEMPQGAVNGARQTYKGLNVRVIPVYDGTNDISKWRLDILYGVDPFDVRLAHRQSGLA